jgi:hypothetical protein
MKPKLPIESLILTIRGVRVILGADLAGLYGVETRALNQAIKRNAGRFPDDFVFQLTKEELYGLSVRGATGSSEGNLKSQIVISSWHKLQPLLQPPPEPPRRRIGFHTEGHVG